jgi:GNAT superfamily N-acetyltransferase
VSFVIRPIEPGDKERLVNGLAQLSAESIRKRFLAAKPRFTRSELRYLTEVDGRDHVALVAEYPGEPVRRLIAVGRFVRHSDSPDAAEAAIVVCDDWQRRGVGSLFAERLAARARRLGIRRFTATMASDNVPAHKLMARMTRQLEERHTGSGVSELVMDLAA